MFRKDICVRDLTDYLQILPSLGARNQNLQSSKAIVKEGLLKPTMSMVVTLR